jgi:hypothetical protein
MSLKATWPVLASVVMLQCGASPALAEDDCDCSKIVANCAASGRIISQKLNDDPLEREPRIEWTVEITATPARCAKVQVAVVGSILGANADSHVGNYSVYARVLKGRSVQVHDYSPVNLNQKEWRVKETGSLQRCEVCALRQQSEQQSSQSTGTADLDSDVAAAVKTDTDDFQNSWDSAMQDRVRTLSKQLANAIQQARARAGGSGVGYLENALLLATLASNNRDKTALACAENFAHGSVSSSCMQLVEQNRSPQQSADASNGQECQQVAAAYARCGNMTGDGSVCGVAKAVAACASRFTSSSRCPSIAAVARQTVANDEETVRLVCPP